MMFVTPAWSAEEVGEEIHVEGAHESGGFPPFEPDMYPSQLLWLAITFGLFYLFLKRVALPRISNILEVRNDRIAQDLDQAARLKDEADEAVAAYEQELADAKAKANTIGQEARDAAKAEADAERKSVEAELDEKLKKSEARIGEIKRAALADVDTIAEDTAGLIVAELVGKKPTKAAIEKAVGSAQG